jgi:hypothetical protein
MDHQEHQLALEQVDRLVQLVQMDQVELQDLVEQQVFQVTDMPQHQQQHLHWVMQEQ